MKLKKTIVKTAFGKAFKAAFRAAAPKLAPIFLTALCCALGGCFDDGKRPNAPSATVTVAQGKTMGTFYTVTVPGEFPGGAAGLKKVVEEQFSRVIKAISTFSPEAELYRFNEWESTSPFPISADLAAIVAEAQHQSKRLEGAMDISVGPLVNLWGFGKNGRRETEPTQEDIDEAKRIVGIDKYELRYTEREPLLVKHYPKVRLDLATVGEGAGADWAAEALDRLGIGSYLVAVAGASRSRGYNPKGGLWKIGIEDPTDPGHKIFVPVCPLDQAVSTAGSYRNYFKDEKSGKIYSHIIDPVSGRPVGHNTLSVTVVDRSAQVTDALDTGLLVWGADKALAWADKHDIAIYTIEMKDGKPVGRHSRAFEKYLRCADPEVK